MTLREKELERQHNRLALVKSAETKPIIIQPNTEVVIKGYMDKMLPYPSTVSMLHATSNSVIPYDLDIVQAIITYDQNQRDDIPVHISNISTRTVTVAPRALLCELQPVTITTEQNTKSTSGMEQMMNDSTIRYWIDKVSSKMKPRKHDVPSLPFHNMLYNNFDKLKIKRGILYRTTTDNDTTKDQLVLPTSQISTVLRSLHNNMGHQEETGQQH
ncbi:Hypothetical predicted protein [Mytilus galloprovincialis]|uniref:Uncharacterized protein n=1 Tax=Mytilus galloprovincialis TaxID=29158 RepID=A0A8B6HJ82_MYTGA|nr:Hypothetical predicted protein [Mytilus galloprovincialis]